MNTNDKNGSDQNFFTPINEILQFWLDNSVVYQALVNENNFIPFVGAGLVAGIGLGSWRGLMDAVAEKVFGKIFDRFDNIDVSQAGKIQINDCVFQLNKIDELNENDRSIWINNIYRRYEIITEFEKEVRSGNERAEMLWILYNELINSNHKYSYYEAGQILELFGNGKTEIKSAVQACFNEKRTEDGGWDIREGSAVLWLPRITRPQMTSDRKEKYKCVTTNFDDILESVYGNDSAEIIHLHEKLDSDAQICFSLSDLYNIYEDIKNQKENTVDSIDTKYDKYTVSNVIKVRNHLTYINPYLFLGSSLSESHIAMIVNWFLGNKSLVGENYAIVGFDGDNQENIKVRQHNFVYQKKEFGLTGRILLYPVKEGNHGALEVLLHQLARDKMRHYWNCIDNISLFLPQNNQILSSHEIVCVDSMIQWLKDGKELRIAVVEPSDNVKFTTEGNKGILTYNIGDGILDAVYRAIDDNFVIPIWMTCIIVASLLNGIRLEADEDVEPLGNTLYVVIEYRDEIGVNDYNIYKQIEDMMNKLPHSILECRILHIILPCKYFGSLIERIHQKSNPQMNFCTMMNGQILYILIQQLPVLFQESLNCYTEKRDNRKVGENEKIIASLDKKDLLRSILGIEQTSRMNEKQNENDLKLTR